MFQFVVKNDIISRIRSGFKRGGSCVNHLLPITHEIYKPFDNEFDARSVFLDISKAFHKYGVKVLFSN